MSLTDSSKSAPMRRKGPIHPPLDKKKRQIRLLTFCKSKNGTQINLALSVFDLSNCPRFFALSYVWGQRDRLYKISLNGQTCGVPMNLYNALCMIGGHMRVNDRVRYKCEEVDPSPENFLNCAISLDGDDADFMRDPARWQYFWIDALCINQEEIEERNHQVGMMGEIYKGAAFVLAWFGRWCEEGLLYLKKNHPVRFQGLLTIRGRDTDVEHLGAGDVQVVGLEFTSPLHPFLSSEYWTRMWIVQEFALAKDILLASGTTLVPWVHAKHLFPYHRDERLFATATVDPCILAWRVACTRKARAYNPENTGISDLITLITRFQRGKCSDVRDRFFALYGLIGACVDKSSNPFVADYSLTPDQLFLSVGKVLGRAVRSGRDLHDLCNILTHVLEIQYGRSNLIKTLISDVKPDDYTVQSALSRNHAPALSQPGAVDIFIWRDMSPPGKDNKFPKSWNLVCGPSPFPPTPSQLTRLFQA